MTLSVQQVQLCLLAALTLCLGVGCRLSGWTVDIAGTITAGPLVAADRVFVVATQLDVTRQLRAFDPHTGEELWQAPLSTWDDCPGLISQETAVIAACGSQLYAYDPIAGAPLWRLTLDGPVKNLLSLEAGLLTVLFEPGGRTLSLDVIDVARGNSLYRLPVAAGARVRAIHTWILIWKDQQLERFDPEQGLRVWHLEALKPILEVEGSAEGLLLVVPNALVGLDPDSGSQRWIRTTEGAVSPVVAGGLLSYAQAGQLLGVQMSTGKQQWRRPMAGVVSAPALTHNAIYVHTAGGALRVLSPVDGEQLWQLEVGENGLSPTFSDEYYVWRVGEALMRVDLVRHRQLEPLLLAPVAPGLRGDKNLPECGIKLDGPFAYITLRGHSLRRYPLEP